MAGFFKYLDPNREGPGVPKDAPSKPRIVVFFEIFFRKFWNLIILNMMFIIFNLPALIPAFWASTVLFQRMDTGNIDYNFLIIFTFTVFIMAVPIVTVGPFQAGFTYILRNYAREEHAFMWGDFIDTARKNLKQSLLISIIDFIVMFIIALDMAFYYTVNAGNFLIQAGNMIVLLIFLLYCMMHMYIYPMLVTFKLNLRQLYKNALILAIIKFLPNLLILVLCGLLVYVLMLSNLVFSVLFYIFIAFSLIGFITNFYVYPKLMKYVLDERKPDNEHK